MWLVRRGLLITALAFVVLPAGAGGGFDFTMEASIFLTEVGGTPPAHDPVVFRRLVREQFGFFALAVKARVPIYSDKHFGDVKANILPEDRAEAARLLMPVLHARLSATTTPALEMLRQIVQECVVGSPQCNVF